jgi:hypothetical protein
MIVFCTYVNPNNNEMLPVDRAFNIFLKELCIDMDAIAAQQLNDNSRDVKLKICVSGLNDNIRIDEKHTFYKSKFITNKNFQHKLEEYYNKHHLFVEQPQKVGSTFFITITPYTPYRKHIDNKLPLM